MMEFAAVEPVRAKLTVDGKIIEQVSTCKNYKDVKEKLNTSSFFCGTIRRALGKKLLNETLLQVHSVMVVPSFLYGCETCSLIEEMRFLR
jgi:hypothetical protein